MVAGLTIGKKGYEDTGEIMKHIQTLALTQKTGFVVDIDRDSEAYNKAYVDRRHFSKIRKDVNYTPNKKTVLAFAIALELSIDEAKDLLNSAGFAFSRSSKTDIIIAYFLQNKIYDMFEINEILDAYGQPIFE